MSLLLKAPLLPISGALIAGLLLGHGGSSPLLIVAALSLALAGALKVTPAKGGAYVLLLALALPTGLFLSEGLNRPRLPPKHIARLPLEGIKALEGRVSSRPDKRGKGTVLILAVERALLYGRWRETYGKVRLWRKGELDLQRGARLRAEVRLREPRNFANPGGFDYRAYLRRRGIFVTGYIRHLEVLCQGGGLLEGVRRRWKDAIASCPEGTRGFLMAILLGERGELSRETKEVLRRTGTYHLLAISGLHIATLSGLLFLAIRWVLRRSEGLLARGLVEPVAALATVPLAVGYVLLVGAPLSAIRAAVMVGAFTATLLLGRRRAVLNALALAALSILMPWPGALWEPAFQLSFSAVGGILLLTPRLLLRRKDPLEGLSHPSPFQRTLRWVWTVVAVTLSAQLATLPIALHHFHLVSLVAPLANLVAVPGVALVALPLGALSFPLSMASPELAVPLLHLAAGTISLTLSLLRALASLPFSHLWLPGPTPSEALAFYALVGLLAFWRKASRRKILLAALLLFGGLDALYWHLKTRPPGHLEVTFLDVGQGDAAFVRFPTGETMLVDGGGFVGSDFDTGERIVAPFLWHERLLKVDYIVLSHPQPDHAGGLPFIARHFRPQEFWHAASEMPPELEDLLQGLRAKGVRVREVERGFSYKVGEVCLQVLHPPRGWRSDPNNASMVLKVDWRGRTVLFTGDIGLDAEREMVRRGLPLSSEVIKVPHHGSRRSSSFPFVREVNPRYAVISVGHNNPFGHPAARTVRRYSGMGAMVLRTDLHGAITLKGDLEGWTVETYRGRTSVRRAR